MRRVMMWCVGLVVLLAVAALVGGLLLLNLALKPSFERGEEPCYASFAENYPALKPWADSLRREGLLREVTLTAEDGTPLHAYLIPAAEPSTRTAVVVHGYTDHPFGMLAFAHLYREELGCNILLPTLRYHGKTPGDYIQMGWYDRLDILRWTEQIPTLFGGEQSVVLHGMSMGAATVMFTAGESSLPARVKCVVEDCGYMGVWEQFQKELKEDYHLPSFPVLHLADLFCRLRYGWSFSEASTLEAVRRTTRPMLFIHGSDDHYVPTWMLFPLYYEHRGEKARWLSPDAGHADAYRDHPEAYTEQVVTFVGRYL